ncbi:MAG: hypothetical protein ABH950_07470 [Candidatus Altiarchaeota archaeon]
MKKNVNITWAVVTATLTLLILFNAISMVWAAVIDSSLSVGNSAPSVGVVAVDDATGSPSNEVDLSDGLTVEVNCSATVTDNNGYANVSGAAAELFLNSEDLDDFSGNTDDANNRYTNTSCALSGGSGNTVDVVCSFTVEYYADPGEWNCTINATDDIAYGVGWDNTTINTLTALSVPSSLSFGSLALGATSGDQTLTVTNTGNEQIDISLDGYGSVNGDGYAMTCSTGNVDLANLRYDLSSDTAFGSMTSLTDDSVTLSSFDLAQRTGAVSTKDAYWKIQIPASGVSGSCSGKINVLATSG